MSMRPVADVLNMMVMEGRYRNYMCNSLDAALANGFITAEERMACIEEIHTFMGTIAPLRWVTLSNQLDDYLDNIFTPYGASQLRHRRYNDGSCSVMGLIQDIYRNWNERFHILADYVQSNHDLKAKMEKDGSWVTEVITPAV